MALFDEACELPRPEVPAFLAKLAGDDAALRASLEAMLDIDGKSQVFFDQTRGGAVALARDLLEGALMAVPPQPEPGDEATPTQVGEYEILERLGAGGMGSVYRARQRTPERIVALKMLHPWLVSTASLERFRFEAQALASLKHPSIPPVYAVGQHEGAVYFAMELVHGPNLSTWAKERQPSTAARVLVLQRICEAVHHAHLRGLVHRDLKPDNLRVAEDGTPLVLDFGIAAGLGERSVEIAGTPAYMSPEQLEPGAPVDVRADVFALGVIAFELLGGELPVVPPKSGLATLQALKHTPSPRLVSVAPHLRGELDHIVARALAVSPDQRYASAAELADDLRRHLEHRPVRAHPGGRLYRAGRFVRRNRFGVVAASALLLSLSAGVGVSLAQYFKAERARQSAATQAERASASLDFLTTVLQEADPDNAGGRGATIGMALDRATKRLDDGSLDPHVEASLRASLANTYVGLGEWSAANRQAALALTAYEKHQLDDDEQLGEVLRVVAEVREESGDEAGAVEAGNRALAVERALHGHAPHAHVSESLHADAIALREAGLMQQAVATHQEAVAMERALELVTHFTDDLADTLDQYGLTLVTIGRYDEAQAAHGEALKLNLAKYGPEHQTAAIDYHHLALLEYERGRPEAARPLLEKALKVRLATLGPDHMRIGMQRNLEARVELAAGNLPAARFAIDECLRIAQRSFGDQFGRYARLENTKVLVLLGQGQADEALALAEKVVGFVTQRFGPTHYITGDARSNHALALLAVGRRDEAAAELSTVLGQLEPVLGPNSRPVRDARARLAQATGK
jgi:tetratricopeptide (TPR) repeat protein/predicted Ser/Thr protein kinase